MSIFLFAFGVQEWVLILLVILLLFGGKKIPELMRGLGKGIREFNSARANLKDELESGMNEDPKEVEAEKKE